MEIWKDIENYEGYYQVSNLGRIKGLKRQVQAKNGSTRTISERIFKPSISNGGYLFFLLRKGKLYKAGIVHRLVAEHFVPNPENKRTVNHINGNKLDNRAANLEWNTHSENNRHASQLGLRKHLKGKNNPNSRQVLQYSMDGDFIQEWESMLSVERSLKISVSSIAKCCKGIRRLAGGFIWKYKN